MKKIIIAMAAIAAAFTTVSCNKNQFTELEENTEGNCTITASTESALTKTTLYGNDTDGYEVVWSEGDTFKLRGETFTLIKGAGTASGTFQGYVYATNGTSTAYYPASYNGYDWPAEQTYTEGNITNSPMTAGVYCYQGKIQGGMIEFKNVGGILRLSVKGTARIKRIKVYTFGNNCIALNCGKGVDLDNTNAKVFHIAVPEGNYPAASIMFISTDGKYCVKTLKPDKPLIINRSEITTASIKVDNWTDITSVPDGALPGRFTVSAEGKRVFFSKGNLYRDNTSFQFESSQLLSASEWDASHISHFYWSKDAGKACAEYYSDSDASQDDVFFTNATYTTPNPSFTANGQTGMWRTLSKDEWKFLLENNGCLWTAIDGINGMIIFCDGYSGSRTGLTEIPDGCAFLPAAGFRNGYSSSLSGVGTEGAYSSSVAGFYEEDPYHCAYNLVFSDNYTDSQALKFRVRYGCSVRLVTEEPGEPVPTFTVTFDLNGKTGTGPERYSGVPYNTTIEEPANAIAGDYTFAGWYKDKACTNLWDFSKDRVTANTTLYAKWIMLGPFTINDSNEQVYFSRGNLYWDGNKELFRFEIFQSDFSTKPGPYDRRVRDDEHVSHFLWSKHAETACQVVYGDSYASDGDVLFTNADATHPKTDFTVEGQKGVWRTLSPAEWEYLFRHYETSKLTINGVYGMIIFCDGYTGPKTDLTDVPDGCVFLPNAGDRNATPSTDLELIRKIYHLDGVTVSYWTSVSNEYYDAYCISNENTNVIKYRSYSYALRLVRAVK